MNYFAHLHIKDKYMCHTSNTDKIVIYTVVCSCHVKDYSLCSRHNNNNNDDDDDVDVEDDGVDEQREWFSGLSLLKSNEHKNNNNKFSLIFARSVCLSLSLFLFKGVSGRV